MEQLKIKDKINVLLKKFKFPIIIVLAGVILMLLPSGKNSETGSVQTDRPHSIATVEQQLIDILSTIRGAGRVEVMLTEARGEQIVYQTNINISEKNEESNTKTDTVLITGTDRAQNGLVSQVLSPVYQGAIIVCQGGDDPTVKLAIVDAVSKVTGLRSDSISVLKMK